VNETRYWRIRIKYVETDEDLSRSAWEMDEVGIWYGAWGAGELKAALTTADPLTYLSKVNAEHSLNWKVGDSYLNNAKRFDSIEAQDWVVVYFDSTLHLAHIGSELLSSEDHPLNRKSELFKYRKINFKKSFSLNRLQDIVRVLSSAGRGNVFQFRSGSELIRLLGQASTETDVVNTLKSIPMNEALELLGPTAWESVCLAYFIIEYEFVPTGLALGRTLADVDIVGRRKSDGTRILAQCKKDPHPTAIADGFLKAIADLGGNGMAFYFAYGGCNVSVPLTVRIVNRDAIHAWSKTELGARYFSWLFGNRFT
jgi:hypothetical protein